MNAKLTALELRGIRCMEMDDLHKPQQRIQRGLAEFELTLTLGCTDLLPDPPLTLAGFKPQIDATAELASKVTHSLSNGEFRAQVKLEINNN